MLRSRRGLPALGLVAVIIVPSFVGAQTRTVVSKEVSVGASGAMLHLEFAQGKPLEIALRGGSVVIDGESVGSYEPEDGLDAAWRALLGGAVALDDGELAAMLRDWSPPDSLRDEDGRLAGRIATALHAALTASAGPQTPTAGESLSAGQGADQGPMLRALLGQADKLGLLKQALKGAGADISLHVDEDVNVAAGDTVVGSLVAVGGDVRVAGTVKGDVVVVGGSLELARGSHVTGDVRLADSQMERDHGTVVDGEVVNVRESDASIDSATRTRIRNEVRSELRSEMRDQLRNATRVHTSRTGSFFNPFRHVFEAVGGLIQDLVTILVLSLIGLGVIAFAGDNLDAVAETARRSPGRSALVGLAGTFLLVPVWLMGAVALAVSIVGIPVMIAWIPLFPLAAVAATLLGYLAVARNVGDWLAHSEYRYTGWIRRSNPVYTLVGGLVGLGALFMAAHVLALVPFLGVVRLLLVFVGVMLCVVAVQIGFGAVILTRGGRRRTAYAGTYDAEWEQAADLDPGAAAPPPPGDATDTRGTGDDAGTGGGGNA